MSSLKPYEALFAGELLVLIKVLAILNMLWTEKVNYLPREVVRVSRSI